jgi:ATP-dependent helicase/DNAse subunit B
MSFDAAQQHAADADGAEQPAEPMPKFSRGNFRHIVTQEDDHVTTAAFEHAMGMVLDRLDEQRADQAEVLATAIRAVLEDKQVAKKLMTNMREAAAESAINATGRSVWRMVGAVLEKWYLALLVALIALHMLGWGPAVALVKWMLGGKSE